MFQESLQTAPAGSERSWTRSLPCLTAVVTAMGPPVAPAGTTAVIWLGESTVKLAASIPLNFTAVAPVNFSPVMMIESPHAAFAGIEVIVGGSGPPPSAVTFKVMAELTERLTVIQSR
jgi:hypothetical protein